MNNKKAVAHPEMRIMNLALILNTLHECGPTSSSQLASMTGLNKATVSSLVKDALQARIVRKLGKGSPNEVGHPSINLDLNPDAGRIIGAEIGVDFISVVLTDFAANILWRGFHNTTGNKDQNVILNLLLDTIGTAYTVAMENNLPVFGLGLGIPGLVEASTGTLLFAPNLGWNNVLISDRVQERFTLPLFLDNEANLSALGECYFGAARNSDYALYISSGIGIGGGIVLQNQIMPGVSGFAGEIGHMTVDPNGERCACGNYGCWETVGSQRALFQNIKNELWKGKSSILIDLTHGDLENISIALIIQAAKQGDPVTLKALENIGCWLGMGTANLVNALNPSQVVFGGPLSEAGEFLLPFIQQEVEKRALSWPRKACKIILSKYGSDACVIGGVAAVYRDVINNPAKWLQI